VWEVIIIYVPWFDCLFEELVVVVVFVFVDVDFVVIEGNYLLFDDGFWVEVCGLLDEVWYLRLDDDVWCEWLWVWYEYYGCFCE